MAGIGSGQFMTKGIEKIKQATEMDKAVTSSGSTEPGRYDAAIQVYMSGLECFQLALKRTFTPARRPHLADALART